MMLQDKLKTLPEKPGCYQMKDKNSTVIYVGKAKNLKNRVNSYFVGSHNNKTTKLVSNIVDFDYIVTQSEKEAFILEYNLIKQYKPRFNIIFMDDASYPYLRITKEKYPTISLVRDKKKMKNAAYYGPYPNVTYARNLLNLINKLYPLRKCKTIGNKVCLYYHLGLCLGPCEKDIDTNTYEQLTAKITSFINGNTKDIIKELESKRDLYSQQLLFEKANDTNELIKSIESITSQQHTQSNNVKQKSICVFNYAIYKGFICITALLYKDGKLAYKNQSTTAIYDEPDEYFVSYIHQYFQANELSKSIIIDKEIDVSSLQDVLDCKIIQPSYGTNKEYLNIAKENCEIALKQKFAILDRQNNKNTQAIKQLEEMVGYSCYRIELFDNSHISGSNAVASQVVYIDGQASKKDYRLYKVSNKNDDYANMKEVLYRRLFKAIKDKTTLPDVIIVDGGKSQIKAANEIISTLNVDVNILGLVKNDKHSTSSLMDNRLNILDIDRESDLFYLLTNMQDEVHRFAISYHKKLRDKEAMNSQLEEIQGIGNATKNKLLKKFSSVVKISNLSVEELSEVVNKKLANNIYNYFHKEDN